MAQPIWAYKSQLSIEIYNIREHTLIQFYIKKSFDLTFITI